MIFDRNHSPSEIQVQYYNGISWVTWWTITGVDDYVARDWRTFSIVDTLFTVAPTIGGSYASSGDTATVSFTASAGAASYQWYADGVLIIGATSSSYIRTDSRPILLSCKVTLDYDGGNTAGMTAHVFAPNGGAFSGRIYDFTNVAFLKQNSDGTGAVTADGNPVAWVQDIGAKGNLRKAMNLMQSVSTARRPLYRSSAGINSLEFDGSDDYLAMPSLEWFSQGHYLFAMKLDNDPPTIGQGGPPIGQSGSDTQSDHHPWNGDGGIYQGFMSTARKTCGNPTPSLASWHYEDIWSVASDWGIAINGSNFYTTATNTVAKSTVPMVGSHQRNRGDGGIYLDGRLGRIILSEAKLTGNSLSSARSWCAAAYS